jgi:hypothetical protein
MMHRMLSRAVFVAAIVCSGIAGAAPKPIKAMPTISGVPDDSVKVASRVNKLLPAATFEKARVSGKSFAAKGLEAMTETAILEAARANAGKLVSSTGDIDALVMIVMMEASKAAEDDLRELLSSLKKANAERENLRAAAPKMKGAKKAAAPAYLKKVTPAKTANLQIAYSIPPDASATTCESKDAEACADELRQKEDALEAMSDIATMKIQMLMDRRQKLISAMSNILKKVSATSDQIISNMK